MPVLTKELVIEMFKYHVPLGDDPARYDKINAAALNLAQTIFDECPPCADTTHAIRTVRDAHMWANAAVALKGQV